MADDTGRPWAVELKEQDVGGGHGSYLRAGIAQAVLYRHYIRSATALDPWFKGLGLDHSKCEAAVAFPTMAPGAARVMTSNFDIAARCGVHVIQFPRPTRLNV